MSGCSRSLLKRREIIQSVVFRNTISQFVLLRFIVLSESFFYECTNVYLFLQDGEFEIPNQTEYQFLENLITVSNNNNYNCLNKFADIRTCLSTLVHFSKGLPTIAFI